ncbi:MAG TPA: Crp/Fnr family transcriptional regulator [Pyrinomonadaceae bacterium]|nr:Crp/Fnr family transcriptional regulator [Pyrinomonadaceae bacterium]
MTNAPAKNELLAALPRGAYLRLLPHLESVSLPLGTGLYNSGESIDHVYFPEDALVSLVTHMSDGATVEVGIIGRDGMVGIPVLLGDDIAFEAAVVQIAGDALRMPSATFKGVLKRGGGGPLLTRLLLYTRVLMKQVAQTAACNGRHTAEKRLARWLLMCHDRTESDELALTQDFISDMLGVRRAGVSSAAIGLQSEGFIRYSRGHITILKRDGLEAFACECYAAVRGGDGPAPAAHV